jgi:hypothetical protein
MLKISYNEAEQILSEFIDNDDTVHCFLFYEEECDMCLQFLLTASETIEKLGVPVYGIDVRKHFIPFPPMNTPSTYWYFKKELPPIMKRGVPPTDVLETFITKLIKINKGEMEVDETLFQ